jgi:uncharacterized membrane protein
MPMKGAKRAFTEPHFDVAHHVAALLRRGRREASSLHPDPIIDHIRQLGHAVEQTKRIEHRTVQANRNARIAALDARQRRARRASTISHQLHRQSAPQPRVAQITAQLAQCASGGDRDAMRWSAQMYPS